jgi:hypothetical protein
MIRYWASLRAAFQKNGRSSGRVAAVDARRIQTVCPGEIRKGVTLQISSRVRNKQALHVSFLMGKPIDDRTR